MNYITPGLRELGRIFDRLGYRLSLLRERRKLDHLEGRLGLLGWQQADYDPGTQHHVDRLAEYERTQAQLTNESASLGLTLQQLEERRVSERETFERQRAERMDAQKPLAGPIEESEKNVGAMRRERAKLEESLAEIDQELAASEEKYRSLLVKGDQSPEMVQEVTRLQQRTLSIPQEKLEQQDKLSALLESLPRLEADLQERRALLSVEVEAVQTLEKTFAESDGALVGEIAAAKRDKQKLERQINDVEKSKKHPYREIGKALADHRIEPLNQPDALAAVLTQRTKIVDQEARVAASLQKSGLEKRDHVLGSWVLLFSIALLAFIGLWVAFHLR